MRIYFDSQIFRYIKPTSLSFNSKLKDCVDSIISQVVLPYSDAHLEDLSRNKAKPELTVEDLKLMEGLCNDDYFKFNIISRKFSIHKASPLNVFDSNYYDAVDAAMAQPEQLSSFFGQFADDPTLSVLGDFYKSFMEMPFPSVISNEAFESMDEETQNKFDTFLSGLREAKTVGDFVNTALFQSGLLFNNEKKFTEVRKHSQSKIDKNKYGYDQLGKDFDDNLKNSIVQKTFSDLINSIIPDSQKDDVYYKFTLAYLFLDMLNISPDTTAKGKFKESSFGNFNTDANHAYFASHCDVFVSDDHGLRKKANIVFDLFNVPCQVLSVEEFTNFCEYFNTLPASYDDFVGLIASLVFNEDAPLLDDPKSGARYKEFGLGFDLFNYFNMAHHIEGEKTISFYKKLPLLPNADHLMYSEIGLVIKEVQSTFGMDVDNRGDFKSEELDDELPYLRFYFTTHFKIFLNFTVSKGNQYFILTTYYN